MGKGAGGDLNEKMLGWSYRIVWELAVVPFLSLVGARFFMLIICVND